MCRRGGRFCQDSSLLLWLCRRLLGELVLAVLDLGIVGITHEEDHDKHESHESTYTADELQHLPSGHMSDKHHHQNDREQQRSRGEVLQGYRSYEDKADEQDVLYRFFVGPVRCLHSTKNLRHGKDYRSFRYLRRLELYAEKRQPAACSVGGMPGDEHP